MFKSVDQVLAHKFVGNAMSDGPAFAAIDKFCLLPSTTPEQAHAALNHVSVAGMGCGPITLFEATAHVAEIGVE